MESHVEVLFCRWRSFLFRFLIRYYLKSNLQMGKLRAIGPLSNESIIECFSLSKTKADSAMTFRNFVSRYSTMFSFYLLYLTYLVFQYKLSLKFFISFLSSNELLSKLFSQKEKIKFNFLSWSQVALAVNVLNFQM